MSKKADVLLAYIGTVLLLVTPLYYAIYLALKVIKFRPSSYIILVAAIAIDLWLVKKHIYFYYKHR